MARPKDHRPRLTTSPEWIERGALVPWMTKYICWLAEQPDAVLSAPGETGRRRGTPQSQRLNQAARYAGRKIPSKYLTVLERRADVIDEFNKIRADSHYKARSIAIQQIQANMEAREKGLLKALDHDNQGENMDHRAVEMYTRPFLDFAFPKKVAEEAVKQRIVINIGGKDAQHLLAKVLGEEDDIKDVDYEIIPQKELESGDAT